MMFISEEVEYSVADFFDRFSKSLPKIVKVSQGFFGEIIEDTFDRDQVIRLHTISRQKRVVAKTELHGEDKYFSIPLTYQNMKLCKIDKKGKVGKEKDLSDIVKKELCLPVTVQFPRDQMITVGNQHIGSNNLPCLELTNVFDEIYFLGNFVDDGQLSLEVIHVPLYLSQLRLSLITGIAGQSPETWEKLLDSLSKETANIQFKKDFGNPEMAEYQKSSLDETSDDLYSYITPAHYYNFLPLVASKKSTDSSSNVKDNKVGKDKQTPVKDTYKTRDSVQRHSVGNGGNVYELIENSDDKAKRMMAEIQCKVEERKVLNVSNRGAIHPPGPVDPRGNVKGNKTRQDEHAPAKDTHKASEYVHRHSAGNGGNVYEQIGNNDVKAKHAVSDIPRKVEERKVLSAIHGGAIRPPGWAPPVPPRSNVKGNKTRQDEHAPVKDTYNASEYVHRHSVGNGGNVYEQIGNNDANPKHTVSDIPRKVEERKVLSASHGGEIRPPGLAPPVPLRPVLKQQDRPNEAVHYENNIPRGRVVPIMNVKDKDSSVAQDPVKLVKHEEKIDTLLTAPNIQTKPESLHPVQHHTNIDQTETKHCDKITIRTNEAEHQQVVTKTVGENAVQVVDSPSLLKPINGPEDIETLTIDEVSEYLKVLGLNNYIEEFRIQQVDGELLKEIDKDILKSDFGMKAIEAARLVKFIAKGHVPK